MDGLNSQYDFYAQLFNSIREGSTEISLKKRELKKTIDEAWVLAIEESLPSLDMCIRHPNKRIEEVEQVLPIELTRNITVRSMVHLSQHTNLISKVEGDEVTPSKLLNVYRDESMDTYENKFLNTLITRLYLFIDRRYAQIQESGLSTMSSKMEFTSAFRHGNNKGKFSFSIEMEEDKEHNETTEIGALLKRVERLRAISEQYINSSFCQEMGKSYVRPPIMRTNAILKNKDLRQCLILWQFIESYENVGCEIELQETAEAPDETYIRQLYEMLAMQYVVFRCNISNHFDDSRTLASQQTSHPLIPKFITEFDELDLHQFDVNDADYKKVIERVVSNGVGAGGGFGNGTGNGSAGSLSSASGRGRLTDNDKTIREIIDFAFELDSELERIRIEKERKARLAAAKKQKEKMLRMAKRQREQKARAMEKAKAKKASGRSSSRTYAARTQRASGTSAAATKRQSASATAEAGTTPGRAKKKN